MNYARINTKTQKTKDLPDQPGVYYFKDKKRRIMYVGKAASLKSRVRSYFSSGLIKSRSIFIAKMVEKIETVEYQTTDSVLEALILESVEIKRIQPIYNSREKDNKSFNYVIITKEDFPRILIRRERDLKNSNLSVKYSFGPFTSGSSLKEALKVVRRIFPFRDRCVPKTNSKDLLKNNKPCFDTQIGLCPGVCAGLVSKTEYQKTVSKIAEFFRGHKKKLVKSLEKEMTNMARLQNFEKAEVIKRQIFSLQHIQDVAILKDDFENKKRVQNRIEGYDIAHLGGSAMVGAMSVVEDGIQALDQYKKFKIRTVKNPDDTGALEEILTRRLNHSEWPFPDLVVVDGGLAQKRRVQKVLRLFKLKIPVVSVVKDERHRPREILGPREFIDGLEREILLVNSESHRFAISYHKNLRSRQQFGRL